MDLGGYDCDRPLYGHGVAPTSAFQWSRLAQAVGIAVPLFHVRGLDLPLVQARRSPAEEGSRLWAEEAERRVAQIDSGEAKLIPGEEVFSKIRSKHA